MDALQPTGSFKIRGIGHACQHYLLKGAKQFISSSGGNAGIAVAHAGRKLGIPVTVVVPKSTNPRAIEAIRQEGAELQIRGESWQEAHEYCQQHADGKARILIHPFDDPLLWPGHASLIDEVIDSGVTPDAIILSVGGGGLLCGVIDGLRRNGLSTTQILAVETKGAHSLSEAVKKDQLISLPEITSIATSLGAKKVAHQAFSYCHEFHITNHLVTDFEAVTGCKQLLDEHRVLVEPACGASIAALEGAASFLKDKKDIVVIVCGGVGVSSTQLDEWLLTLA